MQYKLELGIMGNIKLLFTERNKTNNLVNINKAHTDEYEAEAQAEFDEQILDYEERLILLEVGE